MKINKLSVAIMFAIMLVLAIGSGVISAVALGSFAYFELFYFLCLAGGIALALSSSKINNHAFGALMLVAIGLFVNLFLWGVVVQKGISVWCNMLVAAVAFACIAAFLHANANVKNSKLAVNVLCVLHAALIVGLTVYNLAVSLDKDNSTLLNACYIVQNVSLISTVLLPIVEMSYIKKN